MPNESGSAALFELARRVLPGGISHENRYWSPHPKYTARASGARKWDVEGREFGDCGHFMAEEAPGRVVEAVRGFICS